MPADTDRSALIGQRLRQARKAKSLSLAKLAEQSGHLSKSRISNYEQGTRRPSLEVAEQLAALLGVKVTWLLLIEEAQ